MKMKGSVQVRDNKYMTNSSLSELPVQAAETKDSPLFRGDKTQTPTLSQNSARGSHDRPALYHRLENKGLASLLGRVGGP